MQLQARSSFSPNFENNSNMNQEIASFVQLLFAAFALVPVARGQQDFSTTEVPDPFRVGDFYPPRPEVEVCRPIRDHIDRDSVRFTNKLVTNTNRDITFSSSYSRIMSSRMQSRLNSLATLYWQQTRRRMTVLRAWGQFRDPQITNNMSLHYEGESVEGVHITSTILHVFCVHQISSKMRTVNSLVMHCMLSQHCLSEKCTELSYVRL